MYRKENIRVELERTWITSDLHFSHGNIIKYCNRPFSSAEEMNEAIVAEWIAKVNPSDSIINLGDNGSAPNTDHRDKDQPKHIIDFFDSLPFHKIYMIMGNHDEEVWNQMCDLIEGSKDLSKRFVMLPPIQEIYTSNHRKSEHRLADTTRIILSHYPIYSWKRLYAKNSENIHFHGHSHGLKVKCKNRLDVGWDTELSIMSLRHAIDTALDGVYSPHVEQVENWQDYSLVFVMNIKPVFNNYAINRKLLNADNLVGSVYVQVLQQGDSDLSATQCAKNKVYIEFFDKDIGELALDIPFDAWYEILDDQQIDMILNHPRVKHPYPKTKSIPTSY